MEKLLDYALTTDQRIKDRLAITTTGHDVLIQRLINAATDFIENQTNRRFKETIYTDEVYSIHGEIQDMVFLKQIPVSEIISAQYRSGSTSDLQWTDFNANDYELLDNGESGIVKFYGLIKGINAVRFTYKAGYKIDFANAGDTSKHTLPADITDLAERLVIRWFKRRESEGRVNDSFEGGTINWAQDITTEDRETIARYRRLPAFI